MHMLRPLALAALLTLPMSGAAFADDRGPTAEERARIEAVLKADGFTAWGEIELDDGRVWEVDDAVHADGHEYDIELDPATYAITDRDLD